MTVRRRWPRFSLRTMFVVVTAIGCWLGYQVSIVGQRKALLAPIEEMSDIKETSGSVQSDFGYISAESEWGELLLCHSQGAAAAHRSSVLASVSWFRRLLGDRPIACVLAPTRNSDAISRAFPEAAVVDENWIRH
jgi:hypothetical protein